MRRRSEPETGRIADVMHDGRGVVEGPGKKVFVTGALTGETVRFKRRKSRRNFDDAELIEVLTPSPDRIAARCAVFGRCGGCALQHVSLERQLQVKSRILADSLERIGQVTPARWLEPVKGPEWHYRRRARLAVKYVPGKGRVLVGFRERHAPFVTDMHRCEVIAEPVATLIDPLSELIGGLTIRARLPQIEVAIADNAVALVFRVLDAPNAADRASMRAFAEAHGVRVYLQSGGLDSIEELDIEPDGEPLLYTLPEFNLSLAFEPVQFVQINAGVNRRMLLQVIELLDVRGGDRVLDLFCGLGNFSLPLATRARHVVGIDGDASLIETAEQNARRNGIDNAEFLAVDLDCIDGHEAWLADHWDSAILDPARSGAARVVAHMRTLDPARLMYVSCHPGTLARDAGNLVRDQGYRLEAAGILDMFPHTRHVEAMALLIKS